MRWMGMVVISLVISGCGIGQSKNSSSSSSGSGSSLVSEDGIGNMKQHALIMQEYSVVVNEVDLNPDFANAPLAFRDLFVNCDTELDFQSAGNSRLYTVDSGGSCPISFVMERSTDANGTMTVVTTYKLIDEAQKDQRRLHEHQCTITGTFVQDAMGGGVTNGSGRCTSLTRDLGTTTVDILFEVNSSQEEFRMTYNGSVTTGNGNTITISSEFSTNSSSDENTLSVKINGQDATDLSQDDLQWLGYSFTL